MVFLLLQIFFIRVQALSKIIIVFIFFAHPYDVCLTRHGDSSRVESFRNGGYIK